MRKGDLGDGAIRVGLRLVVTTLVVSGDVDGGLGGEGSEGVHCKSICCEQGMGLLHQRRRAFIEFERRASRGFMERKHPALTSGRRFGANFKQQE